LQGNQSRDVLKKTDKLEQAFYRAGGSVVVKGLPFIASLRSFGLVIDQCFQVELKEGYKESIRMFEKKYRELGISVTPKGIECWF
jgi:hypothetical protein